MVSFLYALVRHDCIAALTSIGLDLSSAFSMPTVPIARRSPST